MSHSVRRRRRRSFRPAVVAMAVMTDPGPSAGDGARPASADSSAALPDRFAEVAPGIFRSERASGEALRRLNLRGPDPVSDPA